MYIKRDKVRIKRKALDLNDVQVVVSPTSQPAHVNL